MIEQQKTTAFQRVKKFMKAAVLVAFGVAAGLVGWARLNNYYYERSTPETIRAKVTALELGVRNGKFVNVIRTDKETFLNFDSPLRQKFQDAVIDLQFKVKKDSTYDFTVYGSKNTLFKRYRNITDINPVQTK